MILTGIKPILSQQKDLNIFLQHFDAETNIPEEDIILINEILKGRWPAGENLANQILKLSVIEYEDEAILRNVRGEKTFYKVASNDETSQFLRELIRAISVNEIRLATSGDLMIDQYLVFDEDNRYRWNINYNRNNHSMGLIAERDPNETKLLDHLSGYILRKGQSYELLIGDYQIVSGFGLWSWRSVSTRKSFESISSLPRFGRGVLPYRSSNEYWYIRGINYTRGTKLGNFSLSLGQTKQDGKIDDEGNITISSSGLHTGETSIEQANNIVERLLIGQWNHTIRDADIVASIADVKWSDHDSRYKQDWSGSVAINYLTRSGIVFGEFARGYDDTFGSIAGVRIRFPNIMYLASARYYSKGYSALRANPLAEWVGKDRNEIGLYQGISYKLNNHNFTLFGDIFKNATAEDDETFPTVGNESGIRWEWREGREYHRFQWKREKDTLEDAAFYLTEVPEIKETGSTTKYSGVHQFSKILWGKLQLSYANSSSSNSEASAWGMDAQVWANLNSVSIYFDVLTTFIDDGSAWIYFWDVNLPGEMTTRVYTKDSFSPAIKLLYQTNSGFELGFRVRAIWKEFDFKGTPDIFGALALEILL